MRPLVVLISVLALTLGVADSGAGAEGVAPLEGKWSAITSAGFPVSFEVKGGQVVNPRFKFHWGFCGNFESAVPGTARIEPSGHWKYLDSRGPFIEGDVVAPDRIEGTVTAPSRMLPGCPQTTATYVAAPGELVLPAEPQVRAVASVTSGRLAIRPDKIELSKLPFETFNLQGLKWKSFGGPVARAVGITYLLEDCESCHHRTTKRVPVKARLSRLVTRAGFRIYARLRYAFQGPIPAGFRRHGIVPMLAGE
jgi:hypothetical protein